MFRLLVSCWIAVLPAGAVASPVQAGEAVVPAPGAGRRVVTREEGVDLARRSAPEIAAARARVAHAEARRSGARTMPDPVLTAGYGRATPDGGRESGSETGFSLSQSLTAPWGARSRKEAGTAAIAAAGLDVEAATSDVVLEAKALYYEAAIGEERAAALNEAAGDARALSDLVSKRAEVGEAAGVDRLRAKVEALRAASDARMAEAEADGAREALDRFLLGALGGDFIFPAGLDGEGNPPVSDDEIAAGLAANPTLRAAQARIDAAHAALGAERAARLPGVELTAFTQNEIDKTSAGMTLGFAIPLWNRNKAGVGVAGAELSEAQAAAAGLRARLEGDAARLVRRDRAAQSAADDYRREILPAARETVAIVRKSMEQGEARLLAWLEARRTYLETLRAAYDAELEAHVTRAGLERLIGDRHDHR